MLSQVQTLKDEIGGDACKLIEAIFRVRDNKGGLHDYTLVEPHKQLIRTGLLGDKSALTRVIDKGRQEGFSVFNAVEFLTIAQVMPNTHQYYIATKEDQAKDWLRDKVLMLAKDARLNLDGSRIIDIDTMKSSQMQKLLRHFPKGMRKEIEYSYITGLAAAPESVQGPTGINVLMDEMPKMKQRENQQRDIYDAVSYFVTQGGQLTMQGVPDVKSDLFWKMYTNPQQFGAVAFYFPIIENWQDINLRIPLYRLAYNDIPDGHRQWYEERKDVKINDKMYDIVFVQKMKIPYFWWDIGELEKRRSQDLDYFKQNCLGIPYDVAFRFISPELLYPRVKSQEKFYPNTNRLVRIGIDVGQERDVSAVTVGEIDENGVIWEIWVEEHQEQYPIQADKIYELCQRYKPIEVVIDNTGIGRGLADMLQAKGVPVNRIEFASTMEMIDKKMRMTEYLAMNFKEMLIQNKYFLIDNNYAIHHVLGVQRLETSTKQIRYSGKQSESKRDDHFWSKCLLAADMSGRNTEPAFNISAGDVVKNIGGFSTSVNEGFFGGDIDVVTW